MYITKIYCDYAGTLTEVVRLLSKFVSSFTCYTEERVVICTDERENYIFLTKNLRDCGVDMDEVYITSVYSPVNR